MKRSEADLDALMLDEEKGVAFLQNGKRHPVTDKHAGSDAGARCEGNAGMVHHDREE